MGTRRRSARPCILRIGGRAGLPVRRLRRSRRLLPRTLLGIHRARRGVIAVSAAAAPAAGGPALRRRFPFRRRGLVRGLGPRGLGRSRGLSLRSAAALLEAPAAPAVRTARARWPVARVMGPGRSRLQDLRRRRPRDLLLVRTDEARAGLALLATVGVVDVGVGVVAGEAGGVGRRGVSRVILA